MPMDPVCGTDVDERTAVKMSQHEGSTFYFCSQECQDAFETDPAIYLDDWPEQEAA